MKITEEQLTNGEVCAMLNEGQETVQWTQSDAFPVPFVADDEDAISTQLSTVTSQSTGIYNLMGQKVQQMQKGKIYIVNGKKVLF